MSEEKPFFITISRQLGSGGAYLGQRIAARLGIYYADQEIVRKAAGMLQVSEEVVEPMDEKMTPMLRTYRRRIMSFILQNAQSLKKLQKTARQS